MANSPLQRFTGAIFDMDGTIIDSMGIWKTLASRTFLENGMDVPDDLEAKLFSMTFQDSAAYCIRHSGSDKTPEQMVEEWNRDAIQQYKTNAIPLKPFSKEFLQHLKGSGLKLSLTTSNFKEVAVDTLGRLGVLDYFDSVTATEEVPRSKHHPDVFLLSASRLGLDPAGCVVFEDSYAAVQGAKKAGMYVVGVYDEYARYFEDDIRREADRYIFSFNELLDDENFLIKEGAEHE